MPCSDKMLDIAFEYHLIGVVEDILFSQEDIMAFEEHLKECEMCRRTVLIMETFREEPMRSILIKAFEILGQKLAAHE